MKAAVYSPGGIQIQEVEKPMPLPGEALVHVRATTVSAADYRMREMPYVIGWAVGLWRKKTPILGMELAGTVEAVGPGVTKFAPGDLVFGGTGFKLSTHAEYVTVPEATLEKKPANMTLEEAAAVYFGGFTALGFLRMAKVESGQNLLVYGASGSVGVSPCSWQSTSVRGLRACAAPAISRWSGHWGQTRRSITRKRTTPSTDASTTWCLTQSG